MSTFGWISAGHRLLQTPWAKRRGVYKPAVHKATVGLELLESIDLLSHASLALVQEHLRALRLEARHAVTDVTKISATPVHAAQTASPTLTQTQTVNIPATLTNLDMQAFVPPINLFNPALGTLTKVTVNESVTFTSNIISQNTSTSSGADIQGHLSGTVTNLTGINPPLTGTVEGFTQTISVPASTTGNNDFLPPTTVTFPPLTPPPVTQTVSDTDAADLAAFTATSGHTTITPLLTAMANATATAPNGNLQTKVMTEALASITISRTSTSPDATGRSSRSHGYGIHQQPRRC